MMEKRAFLAVVLMFLVLVAYEVFLRPAPGPVPEQGRPDSLAVAPEPAEPAAKPGGEERAAPAVEEMARVAIGEKRIRVETDLVRAVLSNRGPSILSWQLKEFAGAETEWVEIVPDSALGGLLLGPGSWEELDREPLVFETNVDELVLGEWDPTGEVVFQSVDADGRAVTQRMRFSKSSYVVELRISVEEPRAERGDEVRIGWVTSLPSTEPNRRDEERYFAALASVDTEILKKQVKHVKKEAGPIRRGLVHWAAVKSKYFATVLVPDEGQASAVHLGGEGEEERLGFSVVFPAAAAGGWDLNARLYAGPIDYRILKQLGLGLEKIVDFGHRLIRPLSKLIYWMLVRTYGWIPNYGVVIILLSTLTKVLFYPLTQKSMKSMQSMQELQPKMAALKEKYKKDPKRMNQEVMKLYKEHGVNPLGGCLPLLLQSPVFFALYAVLQRTIELRRAPFMLWIDDLSMPDVIVSLPSPLPALSLLPILMGVSMLLQQRITSSGAGGDPRQKMMGYMMPIFLTAIFFRMPSGLVLYWLVNTVLSVGQQYVMKRTGEAAKAVKPAE